MDPTDDNRRAWDEIHRRRAEAMAGQLGIPEGIRELLPDLAGKHVLHLQCATGESTAELVELGALVSAVDISNEALEVARERAPDVAYVHADVHNLPLELRRQAESRPLSGRAGSCFCTTTTRSPPASTLSGTGGTTTSTRAQRSASGTGSSVTSSRPSPAQGSR